MLLGENKSQYQNPYMLGVGTTDMLKQIYFPMMWGGFFFPAIALHFSLLFMHVIY